jgi:hypothetical protein
VHSVTARATQISQAFMFFSPSLHHKKFKFETKFIPDVFYYVTSCPLDFTQHKLHNKRGPHI